MEDAAQAIRTMVVRGAPLIGATAAYGMALAARSDSSDAHLDEAERMLKATRPTAYNLIWALSRVRKALAGVACPQRAAIAYREGDRICDADVEQCRAIGDHGMQIISQTRSDRCLPFVTEFLRLVNIRFTEVPCIAETFQRTRFHSPMT